MRFPSVTATDLNGRQVAFPDDFGPGPTLVLIAFQRWQQELVDEWLPLARELAGAYDGFDYYEFPVIARIYGPTRWLVDGGMRAGIPDPEARARTVTLYVDKAGFRESLGLESEETVYALLVVDGEVTWRAAGRPTADREADLRDAVERTHAMA
jgi:hypothetical protein